MMKRGPIETGSQVNWHMEIHPELEFVAVLHADVQSVDGDNATILVPKNNVWNAEKIRFTVPIEDLKSKSLIPDDEANRKIEADQLANAECVTEKDSEYWGTEDAEDLFDGIEEYLDYCECKGIKPNKHLWAINLEEPEKLSSDDFEEEICENYYEPKGLEELQKAIDAFYALNPYHLYRVDYSKYILIPETDPEDEEEA